MTRKSASMRVCCSLPQCSANPPATAKILIDRIILRSYPALRMGWKVALLAVGGVAALAQARVASAEIYMYKDQRGALHFSNAPADPGYQRWAPRTSGFPILGPRHMAQDSARRKAFDPIIADAVRRHRVDAALVKAVIRTESDFVPYARSPKGALGLMQLMPATARLHNVWSVFDAKSNIEGGVKHLRLLLDQYN